MRGLPRATSFAGGHLNRWPPVPVSVRHGAKMPARFDESDFTITVKAHVYVTDSEMTAVLVSGGRSDPKYVAALAEIGIPLHAVLLRVTLERAGGRDEFQFGWGVR